MANVMRFRYGNYTPLTVKKTGTVAVEIGDMVCKVGSNGRIQAASAIGGATNFLGVAMSYSPTTNRTADSIRVIPGGQGAIFEMPLATSTVAFKFGQPFVINAKQELKSKGNAATRINVSGTNVVAICAKEMEASGSTCLVRFLAHESEGTVKKT